MSEKPFNADNDLLQRLNALKPSTVQFESRGIAWADCSEGEDEAQILGGESEHTVDEVDGLAARFKSLGPSFGTPSSTEPQHQLQEEGEEVEDIEDLLADLRTTERWKLEDHHTENEARNALAEATKFLRKNGTTGSLKRLESHNNSHEDISEEKEAENYIHRVLDELRAPEAAPDDNFSASSKVQRTPEHENLVDTDEYQDNEAHDADQMFNLPSVPTSNPIIKEKRNIYTDPDDQLPTWCCICNDDSELKCLDCEDALLFCRRCWKEMHLVEGSTEEKKHQAIGFNKNSRSSITYR